MRLDRGFRLKHIQRLTDRHGRLRKYYREPGKAGVTLPADIPEDDPRFLAAYFEAAGSAAPTAKIARAERGSLSDLIGRFRRSPDFAAYSENYRGTLGRVLDKLEAAAGAAPIAKIEPRHIRRDIRKACESPHASNLRLKAWRAIFAFAASSGDIEEEEDPARRVRRLKTPRSDGFPKWSEEEIARYCAHWPRGTPERIAFDLLLYTGARRSDSCLLGWHSVTDGGARITIPDTKTGDPISIPIHRELALTLAFCPLEAPAFIVTAAGRRRSGKAFGAFFSRSAEAAGVPGRSAHGLRKAIAVRLAEAGASSHEIASITGHDTLAEVERYTRGANQRRLADKAIAAIH